MPYPSPPFMVEVKEMTEQEQLQKVKDLLGISSDYQDNTLLLYIDEVKLYMLEAGVGPDFLSSKESVGIIARGVSDLWNYGAGEAMLSKYFKERVIQLKLRHEHGVGGSNV